MNPEDIDFPTFFSDKLKDRGISLKKLSEATGIAPVHLENLMHGKFEELPSAPYVRGYLVRLGKILDFDGREWWERLKERGLVRNSGPADSLPKNRFLRQSPVKFIWAGIVAVIIVVYLAFQLPVIFGKPVILVSFPNENPFITVSSTLTLEGSVRSADSLSLNGDTIVVGSNGSWQKTVLLQNGANTFDIVANKLLGGQTTITEQILYQAPGVPQAATSSGFNTSTTNSFPVASSTTSSLSQ